MTSVLVMGVSGCGKTTVAAGIAERLGWRLLEGDAFHPPANVAKMASGTPLTDEDRWPWLRAIAAAVAGSTAQTLSSSPKGEDPRLAVGATKKAWVLGTSPRMTQGEEAAHCVIACSALKRAYREILAPDILIYLRGSRALIGERLAARKGHFMPPALLDSQFDTLEEPGLDENPIAVDIDLSPDALIDTVLARLKERLP